MLSRWVLVCSVLCVMLPRTVCAQYHSNRGAVLGGVGGALAGAGIGKHNGETATGALIGGAVGLITGAAVGQSMDNRDARQAAAYRYAQQQQQATRYQNARAVSAYDVIRMCQSGVSEDVIINQIRQVGVQQEIHVQDVIALHRQGVPESVIAAMQDASQGGAIAAAPEPVYVAPRRPPVVVEEYHHYIEPAPCYHPVPVYHYHGPRHYHHHYGPPRSSVSWGVTVRN